MVDHPKLYLRYVSASKLNDATIHLNGLAVRSDDGDDLGTVSGLVVDSRSGQALYVVVEAGGWFTSKAFLAPIGVLHLSPARDALLTSLKREQVRRFPGFEASTFERLTAEDVARIDAVCNTIDADPDEEPTHVSTRARP